MAAIVHKRWGILRILPLEIFYLVVAGEYPALFGGLRGAVNGNDAVVEVEVHCEGMHTVGEEHVCAIGINRALGGKQRDVLCHPLVRLGVEHKRLVRAVEREKEGGGQQRAP